MTGFPVIGSRADSMAVYGYAVRHDGVVAGDPAVGAALGLSEQTVEDCLADLVALRLLRDADGTESTAGADAAHAGTRTAADGRPRRLVAVSPELASAALTSPLDEEIHRRRAEISGIQAQLNLFRPQYERAGAAGGDVEHVHDAVELAGHLHLAAERCRREFVAFRPDDRLSPERVSALQERGVRVRMLLQHSQRTDLRARARLKEVVGGGGEVRTTGRAPQQLMIFDDEAAFLLHDEPGDGVGVVIKHPEAVRLLRGVVEAAWEAAQPYSTAEIGYHEVADDLRQTVVELLAEGLTDEVIARRLGVSVRTCRRHIATVLNSLGSVSRFQAGVQATAAGMIDPRRVPAPRQRMVRAG